MFFNPNMINWIVSLYLFQIEKESPLIMDGNGRDQSVCVFMYISEASCWLARQMLLS